MDVASLSQQVAALREDLSNLRTDGRVDMLNLRTEANIRLIKEVVRNYNREKRTARWNFAEEGGLGKLTRRPFGLRAESNVPLPACQFCSHQSFEING